ncbi:MAG: hypothetical protein J3Q66DRAFT_348832 [Benniella sp.]|nr:MAG: hypothetical protein J3Q66DRAFT_348832 [Benniella sp.]
MRRRQRKLEKKELRRAQAAANGESSNTLDGSSDPSAPSDERSKRPERRHRHRHRSPRPEKEGEGDTDMQVDGEKTEDEVEDEAARKLRRKERRERKEKRAQRRQEREAAAAENAERIPLPFVIVRVPGYTGQSSDSEACINVVRRVRDDRPRKSGKSKKNAGATGDESTMVEIKIPHQDELSIISDTEILGDLGLNEVPLSELKKMLPQEALEKAGYTTTSTNTDGSTDNVMTTVRGGFERALVCAQ